MLSLTAAQIITTNTKIKNNLTKIKKKLSRTPPKKNQEEPKKFKQFNVKDELKKLPVKTIKKWQAEQSIPYSVAMYNTVRDFNLASVIRNASAFAIKEINIIGYKKYDKRGAVGAYNYLRINFFPDFESFLKYIGPDNVVAIELPEHYPEISSTFSELYDFEWQPNQCILIGEEGAGIPMADLSSCSHRLKMTIPGSMRSLNAATAAGIAMYNISRCHAKSNS